ncbi:hypothetical protein ABZX77_47440 [Streptomyces sp. NPDC004237]|uniref:DUF3168 domain-containing protein n=1 Tax=Streptomyces sp. R39 TaxID=3238631 RepID=A0AB39R692_9ACTN
MDSQLYDSDQDPEAIESLLMDAVRAVGGLMYGAGTGSHLVLTAVAPEGRVPTIAFTWFDVIGEGDDALWGGTFAEVTELTEAVALGFLVGRGSVVLGTKSPDGEETVRGWMVDGRALRPLTADQVRLTYREAVGQESQDVTYRTAYPLPSAASA